MSRRSYNSLASRRRISRFVADDDVFTYALRVSFLSYLMQPKAVDTNATPDTETREREHTTTRISDAISNSIFSIGDLFKDVTRDGHKSVKFPEKLLKVLETRLASIAMGKDSAYSDQLIRRTFAAFYGTSTTDQFRRQMKENRKIEELILMFATTATGVLKRDLSLAGDTWKLELNKHIGMFVRMLRECLRTVGHVSQELTARLDMYAAKLAPSPTPTDSGYDTASTTSRRNESVSSTPNLGLSMNVMDMDMVKSVASLFGSSLQDVQREIYQMKHFCTEKAAMLDLKTCLKNLNAGEAFPGRREDFETDEAWNHWRTTELSQLQQLMVIMVQFNPELAKSAPSEALPSMTPTGARPGSVYSASPAGPSSRHGSISSRRSVALVGSGAGSLDLVAEQIDGDDEIEAGGNFTYIPPNPKRYYRRLLELCIESDLDAMANLPEDQEVSLGILSPKHIDLINECALRWRIGQSYRVACFMDVIKAKYERGEVPLECIPEGLQMILKAMHDIDIGLWPKADLDYLAEVAEGLFNIFIAAIYHTLDVLLGLKPSEIAPYLNILDTLQESGLLALSNVDVAAQAEPLREKVREVAEQAYLEKSKELFSAPGVNRALPLLLTTDTLEKNAKLLDKRFPEPLIGHIDIVGLVTEVQVPMFLGDLEANRKRLLESSTNGPTPDVPIEDIFTLFRRAKMILEMHQAFCPNAQLRFDLVSFFEPYVQQWLLTVDNKTLQWVQGAIAADKFEASDAGGHSSSIVDLFDSIRSPIDFLKDLEWIDEYQEARFFTTLSKTISKAIEQYCRNVEELFMTEMFPRPSEHLQPQKQSAWLERARQLAQLTGEKKVIPFNFQPTSCVKLNNIDAARRLLDGIYSHIDADRITETLQRLPPPVPDKEERPRFLFTIKIVIAEGLIPLDSSPSSKLDTFVTLSDENGNRLAKTRTIYETLNPRWDETFDISVEKPLWLMISVRDRALIGKHDTVGRAYLCLDPRRFGDFLAHDLWHDLDSAGRILLRISMEGEKDDIQFYFGRAFRSLKRCEGDMVRIFIDKMSPFISQSLSRAVLKSLVKTGTGLDYTKALENVSALYRSALGPSASEVQIPLPQSEKPRIKPEQLTDYEIEQAITPLFDYLEGNLQTLNTYLSEETKEMVMTRLWKEILAVIERLLVPPLSDVPSDMKPLSDKEVDIVFKWLKFLRDFFYIGGEGIPLETLQNQKYRDVVSIRLYYDWSTDALMEECVRMQQQQMQRAPTVKKRAKTVYSQRNLGTIKDRKREKREQGEVTNGEIIMRILRMRPGTSEFIGQQMQIMARMQAEQEKRVQERNRRDLGRPRQLQHQQLDIPPVPALPS
ncbi:uncharacterized protein FOMMEDRAFT_120474 [Fomitiporia mediterranea MF3/22]|uniref:uncharacterized protein n=1 Tax=Fomitiporia mediterranea (strain MF3/22) TaxID=694068 RepID=UPI0004408F06|nr:uncharacterized protein FOMMEDRAFT_120474 [Fomitiporia mediterranea MF3/22]EJD05199.1 hypothetical protein FOMMEDRAFT_120474 [Fomitiporia mediterranea MF3/22]